jgi:hypothetical protein
MGRETFWQDGRRFPCAGPNAIDDRDQGGWSPFWAPHSIQRKVVIAVALTGSGHLQTAS